MNLQDFFFETGEIRLHGMEGPRSGPPLVLLHGSTGSWRSWISTLPRLVERWQVFVLDLRGHGQSGRAKDPAGYHISQNVSDTVAFLRERVEDRAVLMGHSWGGVVSLLSGAAGKQWLRGIVAIDPPLLIRRENTESKPYIEYFTWQYQMKQSGYQLKDYQAEIQKMNPEFSTEDARIWAQEKMDVDCNYLVEIMDTLEPARGVDFASALKGIECPVLLMQADPAKGAALVQADLDFAMKYTQDVRLACFPGAGHGLHEEQPLQFFKELDDFTASLK
jgi:pimeloyl-ACP methyl ester carboxylesterase